MASRMGSADFGGNFGTGPLSRIDLNALAASVTAHALVAALLALTWGEAVLVEGGARPALVSIDLSTREGGPGPKAPPSAQPEQPRARPTPLPPAPSPAVVAEPRPAAQPLPPPVTPAGGNNGPGRVGEGTAMTTTPQAPAAKAPPSPARPAPATDPQPRAPEGPAGPQGSGGSGGGRSAQAGNSATGNFKGRIYQHLLRHRRTNTIGSGAVLVGFTIAPDGSAHTIFVARPSGSVRFDREALALVRRAAPFPRPPDGAAHSFTFEITGQ